MTNPQNSDNQNESSTQQRRWPRIMRRAGVALGFTLGAGLVAGGVYGWYFIQNELAPLVERELNQTLDRPVRMGSVESFSITGSLRFGQSELPATTNDPDRATVDAVVAKFNLPQLILTRRLVLDITLVSPDVYIEQEPDGEWISIPKLEEQGPPGFIKTVIDTIRVRNGNVALLPSPGRRGNLEEQEATQARRQAQTQTPAETTEPTSTNAPILLNPVQGSLQLRDDNQRFVYEVQGQHVTNNQKEAGGRFNVRGTTTLPNLETQLNIQAQDFLAFTLDRLLKRTVPLPITLSAGKLDADLQIALTPKQPDSLPNLQGQATIKSVTAKVDPLPQLLQQTNGQLRFIGQQVRAQKVTTIYGQVPAQANGVIAFRDNSNLKIYVPPVSVEKALDTLTVDIPFATQGTVRADLLVNGPITDPVVTGIVSTPPTQATDPPPVKVDQIDVASLKSDFRFTRGLLELSNVRVEPAVGGQVTGEGTIQLGADQNTPPRLGLVFQAQQVPGDSLAALYGIATNNIEIGLVFANAELVGSPENLQTTVRFQAPQATFPAQGVAIIRGNNAILQNAVAVVDGGTVEVAGALNGTQWQATVQPVGLDLRQLAEIANEQFIDDPNAKIATTNLSGQLLRGQFQLSGTTENISPETINGQGSAIVRIAGGASQVGVQLNAGRLVATIEPESLQLDQLAQVATAFVPSLSVPTDRPSQRLLQQGQLVGGTVTVAGPVGNLTPTTLNIDSNLRLAIAGGAATIAGELDQGQWQAAIAGANLQVNPYLPENIPPVSPISGQVNLSGTTDSFAIESLQAEGGVNFGLASGSIQVRDIQVAEGRVAATVQASQLSVAPFLPDQALQYGDLLGRFTGTFDVAANVQNLQSGNIQDNLQINGGGQLNVAGGGATVGVTTTDGIWQATVQADSVPIGPFLPPDAAQFAAQVGRFTGTFNLAGSTQNLAVEAIRGSGGGSLNVADGTVFVENGRLQNGQISATVEADQVALSPFFPPGSEAVAQEVGRLNGSFVVSGNVQNLGLDTLRATGSGRFGVAGGLVVANDVQLRNGQFTAAVTPNDLQLGRFSPELRGLLNGQLVVSGNTDNLSLAGIQAEGRVNLSQGIALVDDPLNASIQWTGKRLRVREATAPGIVARGDIFVRVEGENAPEITALDLGVQASRFDIQKLPLDQLPDAIALGGTTDFTGRISGTPVAPNVVGDVGVYDLKVNQVAFEPVMSGTVNLATGQQINLQIRGQQDQIAFALDENYLPIEFLVRQDQAVARGTRTGNRLDVAVEQFPLAALNLVPPTVIGPGPITGLVTANATAYLGDAITTGNLNTVQLQGDVAVNDLQIGTVQADTFTGNIAFARGVASLDRGRLILGESEYLVSASITTDPNPQYVANVEVNQGELQDVLTALKIFSIQDLQRGPTPPTYASGADVAPVGVGIPNADLLTQLRRFAEIEALLEQQRTARNAASPLPPFSDLEGTFNAQLAVNGSLQAGVERAEFELRGNNWSWGTYDVDRVVVDGRYQEGVLTLLPLRFERGDTLVAFDGTIGVENQSGQLVVQNFPVGPLQDFAEKFVNVPVDLTGNLDATATLGGSVFNPQAVGVVTLEDGTLNRTEIEKAQTSFSYSQFRLDFGSSIIVQGPEAIAVSGSLPVPVLPGMSNEIELALDVQNEGLAVLNALSDGQVEWVEGQGNVQLRVGGTLDNPVATGVAEFANATIQAQLLPAPLTDVTGRIVFNRDRIVVESVTGNFSEGQVAVLGVLPITQPLAADDPDAQNILRVALDSLEINLKGLYRGGVEGLISVDGSAFAPVIGGQIQLSDGQVLLGDAIGQQGETAAAAGPGATVAAGQSFEPVLNNLEILLADNVRITLPPVLNFVAQGGFNIDGPLYALQPAGTIRLTRGEVNLFTTQFRLAGGYEQTATFEPSRGLDPLLDIRLIASVAEVQGSQLPTNTFSSEINEALPTGFEEAQTVRIQAQVQGPASQLFDNLELTSSPSRSETEIIALLGGGFVNTLGRGDSTLAIANLAGSALLSPIESALSRALGVTDFRLFPTVSGNNGNKGSALDLAAEIGIDITRKLSASFLKVLTDSDPAQIGLRYRIDDQTLLRGSTDFSGDSRATVEYEIRF
jgi:translocation and assembly module TamB